jgi:hypothetical protein
MNRSLLLTLAVALTVSACGSASPEPTDTSLDFEQDGAQAAATQPAGAAVAKASRPVAKATAPGPAYAEVTIPSGTTLPLTLRNSLASDTSAAEDVVTADLSRAVTIDGREVLPVGARLEGIVTDVNESGRLKGRATITFRFTSLRTGGDQYDVETATLSHVAEATKGEDATKIGVGAGAGAVVGALLGGKDGAAKGAAIGAGAGTGVVAVTRGREIRFPAGADVTSQLTAPLTIRVRVS